MKVAGRRVDEYTHNNKHRILGPQGARNTASQEAAPPETPAERRIQRRPIMIKRDVEIKFRLYKKEADALNKRVKKSGLSRESYMRHLVKNLIPTDAPPPDYHAMMKELRAIGANINQIAQKAYVLNVVDTKRYFDVIAALDKAVVGITNAVMLPRKLR